MARKLPKSRSIKRRGHHRNIKLKIVIICEGEITEPAYLKSFAKQYGNGLVDVVAIPKGGAPITLVNRAIAEKNLLDRAARGGDIYDKNFEVWGLFDVDEHPNISQAKNTASGNGISLAISNPCFELWGILHYKQHNAPDGRHAVQKKLSQIMLGYHHGNSPVFNYDEIRNEYDTAKRNAEWLKDRREDEDNVGGNPSCNVYEMLDKIKDNGKVGND